ncbi:MAG: trypsin-like peptidase domain-containing protein [Dehalococcoidia bacterium]
MGVFGARGRSGLVWMLGAALLFGLLAQACGGDEGSDDSDASGSTGASSLVAAGFPDSCPDEGDVFNAMNEATYQVFGELLSRDEDGSTRVAYTFIGTAWAVRDRLMVTNAHVSQFFRDSAEQGVQFSDALAVQSGTGTVVRLLGGATHPDYTGSALGSPDVGLFTTQEVLPSHLELAAADSVLALGDTIQIVGFPGDVDEFITSRPGQNVPQATSLRGTVTARRTHNDSEAVTAETLDVYQHQAPTTPGTSGSSMVHCGLVAGVNNAGTVRLVVTPSESEEGQFNIDRQAAASNNFGVHVRHIHELLEIFDDQALQVFGLPVAAMAVAPSGAPAPSGESPVGTYVAAVADPTAAHEFAFEVGADGTITGLSQWPETGQFTLTGAVNADGSFQLQDDAPERLGFRRGVYQGAIAADGSVAGLYFELSEEQNTYAFAGRRAE